MTKPNKSAGKPTKPNFDHQQVFENSNQAQIITTVASGKVVLANKAACKLLGYSATEILTKSRTSLFDVKESNFKKWFQERRDKGNSIGLVTVFRKRGKPITCEISAAIFKDDKGIEKSIIGITDKTVSIALQKNEDALFEKETTDSNMISAGMRLDVTLKENKDWLKHVGETSYDVMWNWDIAKEEIYVGESVKEVFGYEVPKNIISFTTFTDRLHPREKKGILRRVTKAIATRTKSWKDSYRLMREDGSMATTNCRAFIVRDKAGKAMRLIGAIQDISRLLELERNVEENQTFKPHQSDILMEVSRLTLDGIWDWNPVTNEFYLGEGFNELFGLSLKKKPVSNLESWLAFLHPEDKDIVEKSLLHAAESVKTRWEFNFRFVKSDATVVKVLGRASIIRDEAGKPLRFIGTIQDVNRQGELEKKLEYEIAFRQKMMTEYEENFKLMFNSSSDILYDVDIKAGEVILSNAFEKEFGHATIDSKLSINSWFSHIHPDDKEELLKDYARMMASEDVEWKRNFRYIKSDGSIANVVTRGIILRNLSGEPYRRIGYMQDVSKQTILEGQLKHEIDLKEKQIELTSHEAKEMERSEIGKELHDNVNQLLGASRLYLEMAKKGGPNSSDYLSKSSEYTTTAIEEIRKLTHGLASEFINNLGLSESVEKSIKDIMEINPVKIVWSSVGFQEELVNDKFKLAVYRIIQEQLNNILKHARANKVTIKLSQREDKIKLCVADNGIGFDTTLIHKGIGLANLKARASFYKATTDFNSKPGKGCVLHVVFPVTELLSKK